MVSDSYSYPRDAISGWSPIFRRRGFLQFHCGLSPWSLASDLSVFLAMIAAVGRGYLLAVQEHFAAQKRRFSVLISRYRVALDFFSPACTRALPYRLDAIVLGHGAPSGKTSSF
ncbi:hypothetical protein OCH239_15230 [Roseivivax halodurans JCM 10272]|uniref:Uncharacterized protein n=1 Tax=Roseivivax halodurans JCM 10272 TaxID=1449350 RepID=X7EAR1_9RHOB|nr:hypothetical protein OCH239_15230 [Roseivivax halodurans JCM 10272]